jgi:hypothetical protein
LALDESGNHVRQELVMVFRKQNGVRNLPAILQQVVLEALAFDDALEMRSPDLLDLARPSIF